MARIKQLPQDFVVREIFEKQKDRGRDNEIGFYTWFTLKKTNWDMFRLLKIISSRLGVSIKRMGHAGVKDKRAVTYQKISVWNVPAEKIKQIHIKDVELSDFEEKKERINLGDLTGNEFEITVRDIDPEKKKDIEKNIKSLKKNGMVNVFGSQRFGNRNNTHLVGREILRNNLKQAVWIYLTSEGDNYDKTAEFRKKLKDSEDFITGLKECPKYLRNEIVLLNHLAKNSNDYAGALRKIPKKFRRMFVHAYQSYLWNEISKISDEKVIPIIGFETDLGKYSSKIKIEKIMKKECIQISDFKIKSMPELSSKGDERQRVVPLKNIEYSFENDDLNENMLKCLLKFRMPKGSYATVLIDEILK